MKMVIGMKLCYMGTQNFNFLSIQQNPVLITAGAVRIIGADYTLIRVGDAVYQIKQQITMIRLDLLIILFTIVLAINHSFTHDGHMNYLHFLATTQSAK